MNRREALAALMSLPATASIKVAQLKPDDVLVVECDEHLPFERVRSIGDSVKAIWPDHKVAVFDGGLRLRVMRSGDA